MVPQNKRLVAKLESVALPPGYTLLKLLGAVRDDAGASSLHWLTEGAGSRAAGSMTAYSRAD